MMNLRRIGSVALLAMATACQPNDAPPQAEIVIGEVSSMTGAQAAYGIAVHNGIAMAIEAANAQGGIGGKKIRVVLADDGGDPARSAVATERLIAMDKAVAILGGVASSRSMKMAPVAQKHGVPMISPSSTHPKVTEVGDFIFRVCFIDPIQGAVMARFAREGLHVTRAAILRDEKSDYSAGLAVIFREKFVELGGTIVAERSYTEESADFRASLTAIRDAKPDLVYVPGYYSDVALIVRQARSLGLQAPFAGGDGWDSERLMEIAGKALEGSYFTTHYSMQSENQALRIFLAKYKKKYDVLPDALAALGYDAAGVLIDAMKRSKSVSGSNLRDAIATTTEFGGVTGAITLDARRNAVKPAVVLAFHDGKQKYIQSVSP